MNVAIIPARGGSKRIQNKNIKNFLYVPIIIRVIRTIIKSNLFDLIVVSTDSEKIISLIKKYNIVDIIIKRPAYLATDNATTIPVIKHAVNFLKKKSYNLNIVACVYPTAVLLQIKTLKKVFNTIKNNPTKYHYGFPVTNYSYPIQRAIKENGIMFYPDNYFKNTQSFEKSFHDAGQFYIAHSSIWLSVEKFFGGMSYIHKLNNIEVQDIDNLTDWRIAEIKYKIINKL